MTISFTNIILLYVYYCIILQINTSCHKPIFKLLTNCYFLDSLRNSVAQKRWVFRNIWKHNCIQDFFFPFGTKEPWHYSLWQVTCERWDWSLITVLKSRLLCVSFKTNTNCYSFHAYSIPSTYKPKPNAKMFQIAQHNWIKM